MNNNVIMLLSLVLFVSACGGGGGGDEESSSNTPSSSTTTSSNEPEEMTTTSDLSEPADDAATAQSNNLTSTYELTVDVALPQLAGKEAFIVICENSGTDIDYDQCFVKASLRDGVGKFELLLPNHQQSLIAEVTPMEAGSNPLTFTWEYNNQAQSTWLIP